MLPTLKALMRQAEADLAAGRAGEARAALEGAVASAAYDPDLYELYGRVLLDAGDVTAAGVWLFLSGRRKPEYEPAVGYYLGKKARRGGRKLYEGFPDRAKLGPPDNYPEPLRNELKALGVPDDVPPSPAVGERESWLSVVATVVGCGGCLAVALVCLVVGAFVGWGWVINQVAGWFG